MNVKIKLFAFISQICGVISAVKDIQIVTQSDFIESCAVNIILSKSLHGAIAAVVTDNFEVDLIRGIHETNNVKVYIKNANVSLDIFPDVFIIRSDNRDSLGNVIDSLNRDWHRKPNALYIISLTNMKKEDLPDIFKVLWSCHLINVLVTVEEGNEDGTIYTYLPYAVGRCGRDYNNIIEVGSCQSHESWDVIEKLHRLDKPDLKNCTFNILAHHYPPLVLSDCIPLNKFAKGIERYLIELLLEKEQIFPNFTFVPETAVFGNIQDNLTVTGLMKKLYENEFHFLFGGFSLNYKRAMMFDFICNHLAFEDIFIPVTTRAGLTDRWKIVYILFEYKVWLLLMFTILVCASLLSSCSLLKDQCKTSSELLKLFGNATQNLSLIPRQTVFKNLIIIHWLWFIFLMSCYYQTRLTSYSTFRAYTPQITEYMALKNYNLTPCYSSDMLAFIKSVGVPVINEEYLDTRSCSTADLALDELTKTSNKYTVTIYYKYLWWATNHMKERSRVYVMLDNVFKTHYAFFFRRGFPLLQKFEKTMSGIVEFGFVQAIKRMHRFPEDAMNSNNVAGAFEVRLLTFHDLIVPFGILIAGQVFALVVFIVEFFHKPDESLRL